MQLKIITMKVKLIFLILLQMVAELCMAQVCGCTDPLAINYDSNATVNDGSCEYEATTIEATVIGTLDSLLGGTSSLFHWNNGYWTYNDHNNNCLYHIDNTNTAILETLCINGLSNYDTEEISQDSLYLYFGDIGNNSGSRKDLHFLRIKKEYIVNQTFEIDTIWFSYEDLSDFTPLPQATDFDCEAFLVGRDSIYLFTKQWVSAQTTIYSLPKTPGHHIARRGDTYNVNGLITGACYLPEYQLAVLCGYDYDTDNLLLALHPFIILLYDFQGTKFFSGNKRRLDFDYSIKAQIEAIATHNALDYYLTNEHYATSIMGFNIDIPAQLQRIDLRPYLLPYLRQYGVSENPNNTANPQGSSADFRLYPNPAHDQLYLDYPQEYWGAEYEILNLNGQIVAEGTLKDKSISLNSKGLSSGKYILLIRKNGEVKTFSFIKKEE